MPRSQRSLLFWRLLLVVCFSKSLAFVPSTGLQATAWPASARAGVSNLRLRVSVALKKDDAPKMGKKADTPPGTKPAQSGEKSVDVVWKHPTSEGGFGRVYFGWDHDSSDPLVAKVPKDGDKLAEMSWGLEKYINDKLNERGGMEGPWAAYVGALPLHDRSLKQEDEDHLPKALVWKKEGRTLADYINKKDLQTVFKVQDRNSKIRPVVAELVLGELLLALTKLHHVGIIHRDIKPDNIILCPSKDMENNHAAVRVKLIDFGSALDLQCWVCPALQLVFHDLGGWQQATRTIDYCPPENKVDLMKPSTFDAFEAAMTTMRVLCPSLGFDRDGHDRFHNFAWNLLPEHGFDLEKVCAAKEAAGEYDALTLELRALRSGKHDALMKTLRALLRQNTRERATEEQALRMLGEEWQQRLQADKQAR